MEFVSSYGILNSCEVRSDSPSSSIHTLQGYDFSKVRDGSVVHVCTSALPEFKLLLPTLPNIILVTGDSDATPASCKEIADSSNIIHWFAQNCDVEHSKMTKIPIGLDSHTPHDGSKIEDINITPFWERVPIGYSNFHFPLWYWSFKTERSDAIEQINPDCVYYEPEKIPRQKTWENQSKYAFVYSPTGNGYDCHRTWEALCLGCIPIMLESPITSLFKDLPVLIVKSWKDITLALLAETVKQFKAKFLADMYNFDKLNLKYWTDLINSKKFQGVTYRTASNWFEHVPIEDKPINYLEIGAYYGANLISVANTYGKHPDSELHCIDPWIDYGEYHEYKTEQSDIYAKFLINTANYNFKVHRGFSNEVLLTLPNDHFDIIYIDGNHNSEYVLEDAVLSFRKLKMGGVMIFDDYDWEKTRLGIDAFWSAYKERLEYVGMQSTQLFVRKK